VVVTEFATKDSKTLIDELIDEQRSLTAVSRFAQKHERAEIPLQSRYYRDLIPLTAPAAGEQYSFEVDLDKCSGCKACVAACHSLNGLEDDESWRAVGLLVSAEAELPYQQTVTTACHHCVDPACLNGCPVLAYEKDPATGIVRHLDDQCIGCQYCVLKCPYEVPQYSKRLGIVRKCDMCSNRLAVGEAPACVQSCPSAAIRINVVNKEVVRERHITANSAESFLPASPDASYTLPTTTYVSTRGIAREVRAADTAALRPAASHWPLVLMLVLTQAGVGGICIETIRTISTARTDLAFSVVNAGLIFLGMAASILHLGRPLQSWRAFIGVRRSWLSREILALNALAFGVLLQLAVGALPILSSKGYGRAALVFCSLTGAAAILSSIMVYVDTPRVFWNAKQTVPRFLGSTLLLGSAAAAIFAQQPVYFAATSVIAIAKFASESMIFGNLSGSLQDPLARSARLMAGTLRSLTAFRFATLMSGVALATVALTQAAPSSWIAPVIFVTLLASELAERLLFFRAVAQPKMPGGVA
jgi:formate dehydrogenase iron-sulfur subunit